MTSSAPANKIQRSNSAPTSACTTVSYSNLPRVNVTEICSYLEIRERKNVARMCKMWKAAENDPAGWKTLRIDLPNRNSRRLQLEFMQKLPNQYFKHILKLEVYDPRSIITCYRLWKYLLRHTENLQTLTLAGAEIGSFGNDHARYIKSLKNLTLISCSLESEYGFMGLSSSLEGTHGFWGLSKWGPITTLRLQNNLLCFEPTIYEKTQRLIFPCLKTLSVEHSHDIAQGGLNCLLNVIDMVCFPRLDTVSITSSISGLYSKATGTVAATRLLERFLSADEKPDSNNQLPPCLKTLDIRWCTNGMDLKEHKELCQRIEEWQKRKPANKTLALQAVRWCSYCCAGSVDKRECGTCKKTADICVCEVVCTKCMKTPDECECEEANVVRL